MSLGGILGMVLGLAVFVPLLVVITRLPGRIAKKTGDSLLGWWVATIMTGVIPGFIAAFLHRKWGTRPFKAFVLGTIGYIVFAWILAAIAYLVMATIE